MIRLEQVRGEMLERFERVDRRFAQNEQRTGRIDQRLGEIAEQIDALRQEIRAQLELLASVAADTLFVEGADDDGRTEARVPAAAPPTPT
jgi:hypothetical protein